MLMGKTEKELDLEVVLQINLKHQKRMKYGGLEVVFQRVGRSEGEDLVVVLVVVKEASSVLHEATSTEEDFHDHRRMELKLLTNLKIQKIPQSKLNYQLVR